MPRPHQRGRRVVVIWSARLPHRAQRLVSVMPEREGRREHPRAVPCVDQWRMRDRRVNTATLAEVTCARVKQEIEHFGRPLRLYPGVLPDEIGPLVRRFSNRDWLRSWRLEVGDGLLDDRVGLEETRDGAVVPSRESITDPSFGRDLA